MKLDGRVALIIGGASGLGRASADACAAEGAHVVVADLNDAAAQKAAAQIASDGCSAGSVQVDATDEESVRQAIVSTETRHGRLDILVNSAGGPPPAGYELETWHFFVDIYLKGPYYACKHGIAAMERSGGGAIVNISSIAGVSGSIGPTVAETGYPAAKHGVVGLTRTIALAYAHKNIRANAVCPGYIDTPMTREIFGDPQSATSQAHINENLRVPMRRWGEASEIGKVVAFLVSDDASFITGQPIIVDGGFMAR
jgi:NAD(P)-dependent dehydrogenase (short-subunit alcohol dehydrogenase family)